MAPQQDAGAGAEAELPEYAGHYRLESQLGSGGMGVVHLARSTSGLKLAVKVVHAEFARDPEFRGRFRQEVAAARKVSGAFTAPVVDADPEAGRPWMATLFIPGPTLADQVKRNGPMPPAQLRRLMAGLAEALRDIHRVGVVHRDLKPSNVLLADDGPKVIDFGISRPKDSELRTETGKLIGTPPFMAPEQFRRPREVGPAADIFALGSVLVHAATGRGPFDSDSPYVVAYQVVHDEPDLTGIPEELAELVRRCLAKEPEDRPTPDELMSGLRSVAASYDTQAFIPRQRTAEVVDAVASFGREPEQPSSPSPPSSPASGRRSRPGRRAVLVGGAVLVAVLSGVVAALQHTGPVTDAPGRPSPRTAPAFDGWAAEPVSTSGGVPHCAHGAGALLCAQRGVVFALDPSDGDLLWRRPASDPAADRPPAVSGGHVLPYPSGGPLLKALDPLSGRDVWQRDMPAGGSVLDAGDMLLLTGADGTVTGVDGASGTSEWSRGFPGHGSASLDSFGEARSAYATSRSSDGKRTRVTAVDPGTGEVRWDVRLGGALKPVGVHAGAVYFLANDPLSEDTVALVRYTPGSGASTRVPLSVPRQDVRATVRGDVVHLLAQGGALEAVDMTKRKRVWHLETGIVRGSAPVSDGRHVYVTAPDGRLLAVDASTGRLLGQTPPRLGQAGRVVAALPQPVLAGGHVYACAPDGTVFAVDGRDPAGW
ncbi:serine/threonine-protein kinase [Streptomyces griseoloalbus]|uniref:Serine/threonine protein kinase/outer membrane protein assembly factor BamB n=1 Tax=Streptomyces griseoloalbus TaxID=67303 RepID=A0A7W8BVB4_9ACTN|nr:serine/threonine-protein kinase [Streptomyces albaduncus]MBB5130140.1 serine/threonine protein kinase/outer membrane protein assembly factor BamB [Streptomyces albaduncus]GGW79901.1 serine/threonine protein kinase [Streptomyces albaduncus]